MLLSPYNDKTLDQTVIPLLARSNDHVSIGVSAVSAALDVARGDPGLSRGMLRQHVSNCAKNEYASDFGR